MLVVNVTTAAQAAYEAAMLCLSRGVPRAPRGYPTLDLGPAAVVVRDPTRCVPEGIGRPGLSPAIGVAEGLFLVAGETDAEILTTLAPFFGEILDSRGEVDGAYGPRARDQIAGAVEKLLADPDTRQAVALVWNTSDPLLGSKDVPCTVALSFYVSDERLCLHVQMRSWDVMLGLCYDLMQFAILQLSVANALSRQGGALTVTATSLHLYERDIDKVNALHPPDGSDGETVFRGIGTPGESWDAIKYTASKLLRNQPAVAPTTSEEWLRTTLHDRLSQARAE